MRCSLPTRIAIVALFFGAVPSLSGTPAAEPGGAHEQMASWPSRGRQSAPTTRRYRSYSVAPEGAPPAPPVTGTKRTYRSYSVTPGEEVSGAGTALPEANAGTPPARPSASAGSGTGSSSRPTGRSKPSYMRADSKARGRFGP